MDLLGTNLYLLKWYCPSDSFCTFISESVMLNQWCHMDYFYNVFTTFVGLECVSCIVVSAESESSRIKKIKDLCSKDEQRSYWSGLISN